MIGLAACLKNESTPCNPADVTITASSSEVAALKGTLAGNGITATEDPRGFFYSFTTTGTGAKPTVCNTVVVDYVAKLMNGTTVDSSDNAGYPVSAFIVGWQEALPLMAAGSKITLYLPPSLAYGSVTNGNVPANSNLRFDITLKAVH